MNIRKETYPYDRDKLFEASLITVKQLGWKLVSQDETAGVIKAETGMSLRSWGENVSIKVAEEAGGNTISVASGVSHQLFGWGKNAENEWIFHKELRKALSR